MTVATTLPFYIPQGWASLYGLGTAAGITGWLPTNTKFKYAVIYGLGDCNTGAQIGDSVLFNTDDVKCVLAFGSANYTMIESAKLAGTEEFLT